MRRRVLSRRDEWKIVECACCKMVFLGNELTYAAQIESHDWLDDYPKEMWRRKQKHPVLLFFSRLTRHLRPRTTERLLAQTVRWKREGKLVDFGCGDASFLERASSCFDVMGIEISPKLVKLSQQRIDAARILEGPVTQLAEHALSPQTFDVVTQFGYLEHEWHPLASLRAAHRVLKPGGVTVIKTPNYASWNRLVMGMDWCGYHVPAHCNYFTPETLDQMLRRAGFEPLSRPLLDRLPTSDSLWQAARRPE
jgi:SAM-dependent methyltransferase